MKDKLAQLSNDLMLGFIYPKFDVLSRIALSRVSKRYSVLNREHLRREKQKWTRRGGYR